MFTEIGVFVETCIVDPLSVVVTEDLRHKIQHMGDEAENDRQKGLRSHKVSKLPHVSSLCPLSLNPSDTILSKLANDKPTQHRKYNFAILQDQRPPFFGSMGPNIVQIEPKIINLYSLKDDEYFTYLEYFFGFRDLHVKEILEAYVSTIEGMAVDGQIVHTAQGGQPLGKENSLALIHFQEALKLAIRGGQSLETYGMSLRSYCQTWMRGGEATENAEFSVMSPHFQTRLNINNVDTFLSHFGAVVNVSEVELLMNAQITSMTRQLKIPNVVFPADYTQAFVDVDRTWQNGS